MRHVDEGGLHAWLDGALDAFPREEAEWIRSHLESCPECRVRLEEERALYREAEDILAGAEVTVPEAPPLEELRARARARAGTGRSGEGGALGPLTRMRRLSWAASVVVALGAGWLAREVTVDRTRPQLLRSAPLELLREREAAGVAETGAGVDPAAGEAVQAEAEEEAIVPAPPPAEAVPEPEAREMEAPDHLLPARDTPAMALARPMDVVPEAAAPLANAEQKAAADATARAAAPVTALASPPPLGHPGLPVTAVSWIRGLEEGSGIRLLQLLPGGEILELIHLRAPADPSGLPPAGQGIRERVESRQGGWVILRAPVSADSLRALARGVPEGVP